MPQTRTTCPRCRAPLTADVEQVLDLNVDAQAKQRLLSGTLNVINCQSCGYNGMMSVPIVYHDPEKELLLTYFPPELGLPVNEQERLIGPFITQVVNRLPLDKRKAYLLRPQTMLTFQTLLDRVLEGDGITREMIERQQQQLNLLRRLLSTQQAEARSEIIQQEEALIDQSFFLMLTNIIQSQLANGEEQVARMLAALQQELVTQTKVGQELQAQALEAQAAVQSLQEASKDGGLTREKLLELIIHAPSDIRLSTLVSYTRSGIDYQFFQMLTDRIEAASGDEKQRLTDVRSKISEMLKQIDEQLQMEMARAGKLLQTLLSAQDIEAATREHLPELDDFFLEILKQEIQKARSTGDLELTARLQKITGVLEAASAPPPELQFVEDLVGAENDEQRHGILQAHAEMINPDFVQMLNQLVSQSESEGQPAEVVERLKAAYQAALRFSMEMQFKK